MKAVSTATTTMTTLPTVNRKSHVMDPVHPVSLFHAVDIFNGDINILDPSLASLDGDFSLPVRIQHAPDHTESTGAMASIAPCFGLGAPSKVSHKPSSYFL